MKQIKERAKPYEAQSYSAGFKEGKKQILEDELKFLKVGISLEVTGGIDDKARRYNGDPYPQEVIAFRPEWINQRITELNQKLGEMK